MFGRTNRKTATSPSTIRRAAFETLESRRLLSAGGSHADAPAFTRGDVETHPRLSDRGIGRSRGWGSGDQRADGVDVDLREKRAGNGLSHSGFDRAPSLVGMKLRGPAAGDALHGTFVAKGFVAPAAPVPSKQIVAAVAVRTTVPTKAAAGGPTAGVSPQASSPAVAHGAPVAPPTQSMPAPAPAGQRHAPPADRPRAPRAARAGAGAERAAPAEARGMPSPPDDQPAASAKPPVSMTVVAATADGAGAGTAGAGATAAAEVGVAPVVRAVGRALVGMEAALAGHAADVGGVLVGRVAGAVVNVAESAVVAAAADAVSAGVAAAGAGTASGLFFDFQIAAGPTVLLGLAPAASAADAARSWWPSEQTWRITAAVGLLATLAGFGYCRADAEQRRSPHRRLAPVATGRRPDEGL